MSVTPQFFLPTIVNQKPVSHSARPCRPQTLPYFDFICVLVRPVFYVALETPPCLQVKPRSFVIPKEIWEEASPLNKILLSIEFSVPFFTWPHANFYIYIYKWIAEMYVRAQFLNDCTKSDFLFCVFYCQDMFCIKGNWEISSVYWQD